MDDMECFQVSRGHPSRREANWERRESSVSDSVALEAVSPAARVSDNGRRAALSRQDALSSGSSNTDSTSRLHSSIDSCASSPWLLSPGVAPSPALSPLWTGSGLPPPPSWTLRPTSTVQRSVSSASSRAKPTYAGWSDDKFPAATRHTANSQPTMSTQRQVPLRPSRSQRPGDWIMQHARVKPQTRPHQLPGLRGHYVRRAATNSDNSISSSDSGGRAKSRDKQVPVSVATPERKQRSQLLSVDSTDEVRHSDSYAPRIVAPVSHEPAGPAAEDAGNESTVTSQALSVPTVCVRRRSVSLGRTSSTFSRAFDEDDAQ